MGKKAAQGKVAPVGRGPIKAPYGYIQGSKGEKGPDFGLTEDMRRAYLEQYGTTAPGLPKRTARQENSSLPYSYFSS